MALPLSSRTGNDLPAPSSGDTSQRLTPEQPPSQEPPHRAKPEDFLKDGYRRQGIDLTADLAWQGGGWLIVTSSGRTVADLIETGRRFESMALAARERGIGIHPMTQILEERGMLPSLTDHRVGDLLPQFVLRVGYLEKYPEPVSLRRPVEWFAYARAT